MGNSNEHFGAPGSHAGEIPEAPESFADYAAEFDARESWIGLGPKTEPPPPPPSKKLAPVMPPPPSFVGQTEIPFPVSAGIRNVLDLHRESKDTAIVKVCNFITMAAVMGQKAIRIKTGRGHHSKNKKPVIRPHVENLLIRLKQSTDSPVTAFETSPPEYGGEGAFDILLVELDECGDW